MNQQERWWIAVRRPDFVLMKEILSKGFDINNENEFGQTALINACSHGHEAAALKKATFLLENGADVNFFSSQLKETAIYNAIYQNHYNLVKLLIDYSALVKIKDSNDMSPLEWALSLEKSNDNIIKLLIENGSTVNNIMKNSFSSETRKWYKKFKMLQKIQLI